MHWKTFALGLAVGWVTLGIFFWLRTQESYSSIISPAAPTPAPRPLLTYSFPNLRRYAPQKSVIQLEEVMFEEEKLTAYAAWYTTAGKKMSLQVMVPKGTAPSSGFPTLLMIRGFADPSQYETGVGTKNAARYFASNGFATVAPDFLGYADSDAPPVDSIEARLERPKQLLDLIASFPSLEFVDVNKVGIWGHSNGGQISLSLLEITEKPYPTVLWAPVSKPFPYSILYYTDDSDDQGKALRQAVARFEKDYDVYDYSIDRYWDSITAPVQLHQGTADTAVPVAWSTLLHKTLTDKGKQIEYYIYQGSDHNLRPDWQTAADRSLRFYQQYLQK